jgi:hypothetical protein
MRYVGVFPQDLASGRFWPQIAALISRAIPYGRGEYTLDDIHAGIARGEMFALGVIDNGVVEFVITAVVAVYPQKRVLYVQYGAGKGGIHAKDALIQAARTLKTDWIETRCRESVARLCRRAGFDTAYQVAIMEIPSC